MKKIRLLSLIPIAFILAFFILNAYKVITHPVPFYDWDEAIYAQVGREMMQQHSLIPLWQGHIWLDKPPLMPLLYGAVISLFSFVPPEISARIFNIILACFALWLVYRLYEKVVKNEFIATIILIVTAFNPIFLQRVQTINIDILVLIGWIGYVVYVDQPLVSFLFLFIAVMSKSLIGFYPIPIFAVYHLYRTFRNHKHKTEFIRFIKTAFWQVGLLSLWYIVMFYMFRGAFWKQHIIESHFKRVTASIESHFGHKIFYLNLLYEQFGTYIILSVVGLITLAIQYFRKKISENVLLAATYLLPWFLFINISKTKIYWYLYPALPQIAFLMVYPLTLIQKWKISITIVCIYIIFTLLNRNIIQYHSISNSYSQYDSTYEMSITVRNKCKDLTYLIPQDTRQITATLNSMGLLITTTKWWGDHPSIVYYSQKKVNFIYNKDDMPTAVHDISSGSCIAVPDQDITPQLIGSLTKINHFGSMTLYKK